MLTRRVGETVVIDGTIAIKIVSLHGRKIRLGFNVPDGVVVEREEVHLRRSETPAEDFDRPPGAERNCTER